MGREDGCIQSVVGKTYRKRPLGIPSDKWENNIKMYFKVKDEPGLIGAS
jgi:hypothetical protein